MYNRIILIGRLTRDPELRYTPSGAAVASFTLAVDRARKNAEGNRETDFINIVAWQKLGENCANYLSKGKLCSVEGRLQIRNYEDKDGIKRTVAEVIANDVQFLSPKGSNDGAQASSYDSGFGSGFGGGMSSNKGFSSDDFSNEGFAGEGFTDTDDDLPF